MDISSDPNALERLLLHLKERQLESIPVYNLVRHARDKKLDKMQVFADLSAKDCTTVLCYGPDVLSHDSNFGVWQLYSDDENKLVSMLDNIRLIERRLDGFYPPSTVIFSGVDEKVVKTITEYMTKHRFQIHNEFTRRQFLKTLDEDIISSAKQQALALPKGFTIAPLKPEHAELVASNGKYQYSPVAFPLMRKLIQEFPSFAIYPPNQDEPVSWTMVRENGTAGFAYTKPEYRNQHFAQITLNMVMSRLYEYGYNKVYIHTGDDNKAVFHMLKKVPGFTKLNLFHYITFKKAPMESKL